jgi:hypothetical protein
MIMVWNPAQVKYNGSLTPSLYYSGLSHAAGVKTVGVSREGGTAVRHLLSKTNTIDLKIELGPRELTWIVIGD